MQQESEIAKAALATVSSAWGRMEDIIQVFLTRLTGTGECASRCIHKLL